MKKLLLLFVAVIATSCSSDDPNPVAATNQTESLSVLDGGLLSYKDDASFIKEYSTLSELKSTKDLQDWISKKGHSSFLNISTTNEELQDSIISNNRIIYSDALKSIINVDSKFKVNGEVIWLNEGNLFRLSEKNQDKNSQELKSLKNDLEVYGNVLGSLPQKVKGGNPTSRIVPNSNRSKEWTKYYRGPDGRDKVIILTLYNETIVLRGVINSSKMFLSCVTKGKYCSFWKCRWNDSSSPKNISIYIAGQGSYNEWISYGGTNQAYYNITENFSLMIDSLNIYNGTTVDYPNYKVYGFVGVEVDGYPAWSQQLSWY
jgi:hypothetical protein